MNYEGKWFTNLTGIPDDMFFVTSSKDIDEKRVDLRCLKLTRTLLIYNLSVPSLKVALRPVDPEVFRPTAKHLVIQRMFRSPPTPKS
jgi:hypothetical protein